MKGVSKKTMVDLDRAMERLYGVPLEAMMQKAGAALAALATARYPQARNVLVCVGPGNNGGGGLAAARRLKEKNKQVRVVLSSLKIKKVPAEQLKKLKEINVDVVSDMPSADTTDIILDALLGYSINGRPRGRIAEYITRIRAGSTPVISLDMPSGLDPDRGVLYPEKTVIADATLAVAYPKKGLLANGARQYVGDIYVADIGVPRAWYEKHDIGLSFAEGSLYKKYESGA